MTIPKRILNYIQSGRYDLASKEFISVVDNKHDFHIESLLYRITDDYDGEKRLIDQLFEKFSDWDYIKERKEWHALSDFDKHVPRDILRGTSRGDSQRNSDIIPSASTLEQLCFVTGGDSRYFSFIVELIESLKATQSYKNVSICILDGGFSDAEKDYLKQYVDAIVEPKTDVEIPFTVTYDHKGEQHVINKTKKWYDVITARAFLPDYFTKYRYFVYLSPRSWIQDEQFLDQLIHLGIVDGVSLVLDDANSNYSALPKTWDETIKARVSANAFCLDREMPFFSQWQLNLKTACQDQGFSQKTIDQVMSYTASKFNVTKFLPSTLAECAYQSGFPILKEGFDNVLFSPRTFAPIGLVLNPFPDFEGYRIPTTKVARGSAPFTQSELQKHIENTRQFIKATEREKTLFNNQKLFSYRYRVWPWKENIQLKDRLNHEVLTDKYGTL